MEREFVTYEQALALKELGFREDVLAWYDTENKLLNTGSLWQLFKNDDDVVLAPLKQQVFRWFREKYNMLACVYSNASGFLYEYHDTIGGTHRFDSGFTGDCEYSGAFTTYEKAENACIDKLIELTKTK